MASRDTELVGLYKGDPGGFGLPVERPVEAIHCTGAKNVPSVTSEKNAEGRPVGGSSASRHKNAAVAWRETALSGSNWGLPPAGFVEPVDKPVSAIH